MALFIHCLKKNQQIISQLRAKKKKFKMLPVRKTVLFKNGGDTWYKTIYLKVRMGNNLKLNMENYILKYTYFPLKLQEQIIL